MSTMEFEDEVPFSDCRDAMTDRPMDESGAPCCEVTYRLCKYQRDAETRLRQSISQERSAREANEVQIWHTLETSLLQLERSIEQKISHALETLDRKQDTLEDRLLSCIKDEGVERQSDVIDLKNNFKMFAADLESAMNKAIHEVSSQNPGLHTPKDCSVLSQTDAALKQLTDETSCLRMSLESTPGGVQSQSGIALDELRARSEAFRASGDSTSISDEGKMELATEKMELSLSASYMDTEQSLTSSILQADGPESLGTALCKIERMLDADTTVGSERLLEAEIIASDADVLRSDDVQSLFFMCF